MGETLTPDPVGLIIKTVQIRYVQEWTQVLQNSALVLPPGVSVNSHQNPHSHTKYDPYGGQTYNCSWPQHIITCLQRLGTGVHSMRSLDEIFNISTATGQVEDCCQRELVVWRRQIEDGIAKIPKFSTFL
jgi:hypothetical protein